MTVGVDFFAAFLYDEPGKDAKFLSGKKFLCMRILGTLFLTFLKIGAFTFGGGYAMVALLETEFVEKRGWLTQEEFLDMTAIAESTPGPMAVNSATYLGYRLGGFAGAAISTLAVALPSFLIIYLIFLFFDRFLALSLVARAFRGIQICVVYLICSAGIKMYRSLEHTVLNRVIFLAVAGAMAVTSLFAVNFSSIFYILISGAVGVLAYGLGRARQREGKK